MSPILLTETYKDAKKYDDWRKMLDEEDKNIDGVVISTPDGVSTSAISVPHCSADFPGRAGD